MCISVLIKFHVTSVWKWSEWLWLSPPLCNPGGIAEPNWAPLCQCGPQMQRDGDYRKKKKAQSLSDWGGIEATSKWQRGGAGGGRAPTSVHLSFICLISSDALPSRKGGTLGSHSISPPGFLTILWYWRRVILKDLLSHSQLYLEVGGGLGDPLGEAPRRCVVSPEQRTPEWLHLVREFRLAGL